MNNATIDKAFGLLGKKGRDVVTGFEGALTSVSFDLYGCIQIAITPPVGEKGEIKDGRWIDSSRIVVTDHALVLPVPAFADNLTGPAEKGPPR